MEDVLRDAVPAPFDVDEWRVPYERYVAKFQPLARPQQRRPATHPSVVAEKAELERQKGG